MPVIVNNQSGIKKPQFCVIIDDGICWNNAQLIIVENKKKIAANKDIDTDQGHNILYAHAYITEEIGKFW